MHDVAIIGAGAAGIACVQEALKAGLKAIVFDQSPETFGGTCLNRGCIPTKFFINQSKLKKSWEEIVPESKALVEKIKNPLLGYLEKQGVQFVWAMPRIKGKNDLEVDGYEFRAQNIIIATGSRPHKVFDHPNAIVAEDVLSRPKIPQNILIVGAGYIGIEFASLLNSYGKKVTVVEKEDRILLGYDVSLANRLRLILEKKGIIIETAKAIGVESLGDFELVLLATGRVACSDNLGLDSVGVELDRGGWIKTDSSMRTNVDNIYACGDVTGKNLLAYTGEYQAHLCISNIKGETIQEDYYGLPQCVFSTPQIAKVGILQEEAKEKNINYKVLKSNFLRFSSSYVYNDEEGYIEVILDENDKILGAAIISKAAADLINTFSLCIKNNLSLTDLKKCLFIHPTLSEIIPLLSRSAS